MDKNQNGKSLSEVFQELQQSKNKQVEFYKETQKRRMIKDNNKKSDEKTFVFHVKHRTKFDNVRLIIIVLILALSVSMFSSNYIFAVDLEPEEEKVPIATFEENEDVTDVYEIVSENISISYQKEVLDVEEEIEFETEYIENKDLPKDEEIVDQEGVSGSQIVTYVRSYENNEMTDEKIIGYNVIEEPVTEIIEVGTSEVLAKFNIHIGDTLYVTKDVELMEEPDSQSENLGTIPSKYDVTSVEVIEDTWMKVKYKETEGYIKAEDLTSVTLNPEIIEECRKQKILNSFSENIQLNSPSGFLKSDFEKVFANNSKDVTGTFSENYAVFSEIETTYNINGVFVAAIAIHESNWGTSSIAINKKNLFGYGAYDSSPYESAVTFETYEEGIKTVALWLAKNYINESGTVLPNGEIATGRYYNGSTVSGVNTRYATDTNWSTRVLSIMQDIYDSI